MTEIEGANDQVLFREVQRFRQPWLWLVAAMGLSTYAIAQQLLLDEAIEGGAATDAVMVAIGLLVGAGLPLFLLLANLATEVRRDGIYVRFSPLGFSYQRIPLDQIAEYYVRTYSPLREYGGWGIKGGAAGQAFNVSGNMGLQLELVDGNATLIGSRRAEDLARAVERAKQAQ